MLYIALFAFVLWVLCFADAITTDDDQFRNLSKEGWLVIVLLLPLVGSVLWLLVGRPQKDQGGQLPTDPEEAEFVRRCRERAEEQRREGFHGRDQE
ncbi:MULTISPECIES: PLDc N-terminal domain-containing protein [unclassified Rhodococcus (in: high G+C Gram-positive bacteria)]|uniref:PLDc N-terminal domain-containing protein n=1 Tax=unclassified Rhodococcus (in: high G+C Gram-positive bacteria) TaxID=192944 RepID=UPI0024B763A3|nr:MULTISPECIES: PLDc N-terminal domain-containing protein [unclassified Rhodococcus (in: high G+C Gram-positive bacteria)]MDI9951648.1 PLDc N-terminal domain-containing protein [Rhodococcus sp. IEGM 1305]MDI9972142.1 PLDc N-terminal domain-containing protein [Rhodococcus sp. IEGM 1307]